MIVNGLSLGLHVDGTCQMPVWCDVPYVIPSHVYVYCNSASASASIVYLD